MLKSNKPKSNVCNTPRQGFSMFGFLAGGLVGGCIGVLAAISIQKHVVEQMFDPRSDFVPGGQSMIIFLPLCAFIGSMSGLVVGAAFSPMRKRAYVWLALIVILNAVFLWIIIESLFDFFQNQTAEYQSMYRERIALHGALAITLAVALVSALLALVIRWRRNVHWRKTAKNAI